MPIELPESFWEKTWTHRAGVKGEIMGGLLAAGLGSRMTPLTSHHLPKPMFPLGGRTPMAERWVRLFVESGITDISMNLCVLAPAISAYFGDGARHGAIVQYVDEDKPTGTLGGVCKQALGREARSVLEGESVPAKAPFGGSTVVIPSGDIVTDFNAELLGQMYDLHKQVGSAFTMVLTPVPWDRRIDFGTAVLEDPRSMDGLLSSAGRIKEFREKDPDSPSNLNNASIYMIEMDLLRALDPQRTAASLEVDAPFYDFGKQVFPLLLGELAHGTLARDFDLWGVQYDGGWFDVGNKRDYIRVNEALLDGEIQMDFPYERFPWGYMGVGCEVDLDRVTIKAPVVIGDGCVVEPGAVIGPYAVIGDGWRVGAGARVQNAVLWPGFNYHRSDGTIQPAGERLEIEPREVAAGVSIKESVVVGGRITEDLDDRVVDVLEDGTIEILPLDHVPKGPRA